MSAIVFIDPYTSYKYLLETSIAHDLYTIVLFLNKNHRHYKKIRNFKYDCVMDIDDDIEATVTLLHDLVHDKNLDLRFIISGSDDASVFSEELLSKMKPSYSNGELSSLRTNKYETIELLKEKGLSKLNQVLVTMETLEASLSTISKFNYPVITKPAFFGSGQEGVVIFDNLQDLEATFLKESYTHVRSQKKLDTYVVQECLSGEEWVLDTVSFAGEHKITSFFRYKKDKLIYRYVDVIKPTPELGAKLENYTKSILDAIAFKYGLNHIEIIMLPSGDIELIEINPRVSGGNGALQVMAQKVGQPDQLSYFYAKLLGRECLTKKLHEFSREIPLYNRDKDDAQFQECLSQLKSDEHTIMYQDNKVISKSSLGFDSIYRSLIISDDDQDNIISDTEQLLEFDHF